MTTAQPLLQPAAIHYGLAIYRAGSGAPVLFMPGPHRNQRPGLSSADAIINGLVTLGRQVLTFDPPDSGRSNRPAQLGMKEMHDCADETLSVCGVEESVDVFGHSMGGLVSLAYALEHPQRVRRLVLVGTGSGGPAYMNAPGALANRTHPAFAKMAFYGLLHMLLPNLATHKMMVNFMNRASHVDPRFFQPAEVQPRDWLRRPEHPYSMRWHSIARRLDYAPRLAEISAPTLVLCGRHDPQFPLACSEELAANIHGAQARYFERSGHYPFIEEADEFWPVVAGFLA